MRRFRLVLGHFARWGKKLRIKFNSCPPILFANQVGQTSPSDRLAKENRPEEECTTKNTSRQTDLKACTKKSQNATAKKTKSPWTQPAHCDVPPGKNKKQAALGVEKDRLDQFESSHPKAPRGRLCTPPGSSRRAVPTDDGAPVLCPDSLTHTTTTTTATTPRQSSLTHGRALISLEATCILLEASTTTGGLRLARPPPTAEAILRAIYWGRPSVGPRSLQPAVRGRETAEGSGRPPRGYEIHLTGQARLARQRGGTLIAMVGPAYYSHPCPVIYCYIICILYIFFFIYIYTDTCV